MDRELIQAVSFDAAGTLIHLASPVGESYAAVARKHGIEADPDQLNDAFRAVWKRTPLPFSPESHIRDPNEKAWWSRLVRSVFEEVGAELPDADEYGIFFEDLYDHFERPGTWVADPDALEVVNTVSSAFQTFVLSNFDARLRRILSDLDLLNAFEAVILSCEMGASKPDPKIFEAAASHVGIAAPKILHVGDDPICDWQGAEESGFQVFRVGKGQARLGELLRELSLA